MAVEYREGDLFKQADVQAVGHGVNCKGVMGAGIAVLFRRRWPRMYEEYQRECAAGRLQLGGIMPWVAPENIWVYNLASQFAPGANATYEGVEHALEAMLDHMRAHDVASVALPQIGCGIGGLEWHRVTAIVERIFAHEPEKVVLVTFSL